MSTTFGPKAMLVKGKKYRITYRGPQQRKDRVLVGLYLGTDEWKRHVFSLRPQSGTTTMPDDYTFTSELVPDTTPCGEVKP
jgi:hypothetical protein